MVSTVRTRPSHYELLGVAPTASSDEVARAFAREMGRPRAFGAIAEISVAYEVLRDPARRRAYDATLGLTPKPKPAPLLSSSGVGGAAFLARPAERAARPDIAAALRELARPEPLHDPVPPVRPEPVPPAAAERVQLAIDTGADAAGVPWKPVALAAGGLALAVAGLGAWAGWDGRGGAEAAGATAAKVALPPPTTFTVEDPAAAAAAARVLDEPRAAEPKRAPRIASRVARARPEPRPAQAQVAPTSQADPLAAQPDSTEPTAAPAAPAAEPVAASLPLPKAVIARTIGRIGYPCGAVASASASGAPGVFTVTCTSGHSYRAAPVRGRYHFRRLASR